MMKTSERPIARVYFYRKHITTMVREINISYRIVKFVFVAILLLFLFAFLDYSPEEIIFFLARLLENAAFIGAKLG